MEYFKVKEAITDNVIEVNLSTNGAFEFNTISNGVNISVEFSPDEAKDLVEFINKNLGKGNIKSKLNR